MKVLGNIFIVLTVLALILVPAFGCARVAGPSRPEGVQVPPRPQDIDYYKGVCISL